MKIIKVMTGRPYDILIENGLIDRCGDYIRKISKAKKALIISDTNVFSIYGERVIKTLEKSNFEVYNYVFTPGEESKKLETIYEIYDTLANNYFTRSDIIIALGGGVTGDISGFAASTYLRGINFVQIPTSLLAQVDSSVGGKTGVNIKQGKNLVGSFWQPISVIIDPNTIDTLTDDVFTDGMGEVIKYGCIKSKELFEILEEKDARNMIEDIIFRCVSIKKDVVEKDECDHGERAILNFGHTMGHAIEKEHNFSEISHGKAVAIGMTMITKASEQIGMTEIGVADKIIKLCNKYGLPTTDNTPIEKLVENTFLDKKSNSDSISLIIINNIGNSKICVIKKEKMNDFITGKLKIKGGIYE